jgi:hypothetical protein
MPFELYINHDIPFSCVSFSRMTLRTKKYRDGILLAVILPNAVAPD